MPRSSASSTSPSPAGPLRMTRLWALRHLRYGDGVYEPQALPPLSCHTSGALSEFREHETPACACAGVRVCLFFAQRAACGTMQNNSVFGPRTARPLEREALHGSKKAAQVAECTSCEV